MLNIHAIVLDLDGTLLDSDKSISSRNYEAVKGCYESGIHIIVATARPPRAANRFLNKFPFVDYLVYYNGALTLCKSKQTERHFSIPIDISKQINNYIELQAPQSIIIYEVNDLCYTCKPLTDSEHSYFGNRSNDPKPLVVDKDFFSSLSPTKILVHGYSTWMDAKEKFGDDVNLIATDGGALVQIMQKSASKEEAVRRVLDDIGVNPKNVMVFGDDFNDLGLFQICGMPIAMDNAINELKNCAVHITESNDNDGVAAALERLVL